MFEPLVFACSIQFPAAQPPVQVAQERRTYAECGYPGFGMAVGAAGDLDGDGVPDFIVGDCGDAVVPPTIWSLSGKDGHEIWRRTSPPESRDLSWLHGASVDGGVDVDGDRVPDLLVGSHDPAVVVGFQILSGKTGETLRWIEAPAVARKDIRSARFASDVDHDGTRDIVVLVLHKGDKKGSLLIESGKSGAVLATIAVDNENATTEGVAMDVGDVDGDGSSDVAVLLNGSEQNAARVQIVSIKKAQRIWEHPAPRKGHVSTMPLIRTGNVDANGASDLAVGFRDSVSVLSAKNGQEIHYLEPPLKDDPNSAPEYVGFGWSLAALGDIDGDGFADLAVSETERDLNEGNIYARSGANGTRLWMKTLPNAWHFGRALAAIGDINGDGQTDLLVGSCALRSREVGVAAVLSGKTGDFLFGFTRQGNDVIVTKGMPPTITPR